MVVLWRPKTGGQNLFLREQQQNNLSGIFWIPEKTNLVGPMNWRPPLLFHSQEPTEKKRVPFLFPVFMETQEPTEKKRALVLFPVFTETQSPREKKRVPFLFPVFSDAFLR
jgi:hypothetical protein